MVHAYRYNKDPAAGPFIYIALLPQSRRLHAAILPPGQLPQWEFFSFLLHFSSRAALLHVTKLSSCCINHKKYLLCPKVSRLRQTITIFIFTRRAKKSYILLGFIREDRAAKTFSSSTVHVLPLPACREKMPPWHQTTTLAPTQFEYYGCDYDHWKNLVFTCFQGSIFHFTRPHLTIQILAKNGQ